MHDSVYRHTVQCRTQRWRRQWNEVAKKWWWREKSYWIWLLGISGGKWKISNTTNNTLGWTGSTAVAQCYFTSLNLKKMKRFQVCLPCFVWIHSSQEQNKFLKSDEGSIWLGIIVIMVVYSKKSIIQPFQTRVQQTFSQ